MWLPLPYSILLISLTSLLKKIFSLKNIYDDELGKISQQSQSKYLIIQTLICLLVPNDP